MILEAVLQAQLDRSSVHMEWKILVEARRKRRGDNLLKTGRNKEGQMECKLNIDAKKGDDSRVPVEIWDRRAW